MMLTAMLFILEKSEKLGKLAVYFDNLLNKIPLSNFSTNCMVLRTTMTK